MNVPPGDVAGLADAEEVGLRYAKQDMVAFITIDRPEVGNALSRSMRPVMSAIWADARDDPDVRAVVITGTGDRHFCTGIDVREVAAEGTATSGPGRAIDEIVWSPFSAGLWKPVICALNGLVAGAGLHFVADADVVVAATNVEIMDTHTSIGMVGAVENVGLSHRMPLGSALRMTLSGRHYRMSAERAHQIGLVDELFAPGDLLTGATEIAAAMASNSPEANRLSKLAIWSGVGAGREDAAELAWALARAHWGHPDFREGPRAFAERRPPEWTVG